MSGEGGRFVWRTQGVELEKTVVMAVLTKEEKNDEV